MPTPSPSCRACSREFATAALRDAHVAASAACAAKLGVAPPAPRAAPPAAAAWTAAQVGALQEAHASTDCGAPRFWEAVARRVDGRTPAECHARWFGNPSETSKRQNRDGAALAAKRVRRGRDAAAAVEAAARGCGAAPPERRGAARAALRAAVKGMRAAAGDARTASEVAASGVGFARGPPPAPASPPGRALAAAAARAAAAVASPAAPPPGPARGAAASPAAPPPWRPKRTYVASLQRGGAAPLADLPLDARASARNVVVRGAGLVAALGADGAVAVRKRAGAGDDDDDDDDDDGDLLAPRASADAY